LGPGGVYRYTVSTKCDRAFGSMDSGAASYTSESNYSAKV